MCVCVCVCVCVCEISGIKVILLDTLLITDTHSHVENSELCNAVMQHTCVQQQKRERERERNSVQRITLILLGERDHVTEVRGQIHISTRIIINSLCEAGGD